MVGIDSRLREVLYEALKRTKKDFTVTEGLRTRARQRKLFEKGATKTLNSRHLTGHAVDIYPFPIPRDIRKLKFEDFYPVADAMIEAAKEVGVAIRWGGNWRVPDVRVWEAGAQKLLESYPGDFYDLPHFEIPRGFE